MTCTQAQLEIQRKTMKENMLGKLMLAICEETALGKVALALINVPVEMFGTLLDLVKKLAGEKGEETWKNLKHFLRGEFEIKLPALIRWLDTTTTSATTERFVAKDKFTKDSKEVKFYGFFGSFEEDFLAGKGKIETPLREQKLRYGELVKPATDLPKEEDGIAIIPELGGEVKAEASLKELHGLLKKQGNGEKEGALLTDGRANIFYIRNISGVLRAVTADWGGGGWFINASSVEDPDDWLAGNRVFSRNS